MAQTGKIRVSFETLKSHYPTYKTLPPPLQKLMNDLNRVTPGNTPCCVQISHALNKSNQRIPPRSFRRPNSPVGGDFYILAVDELEQHLAGLYGRGEEIKRAPTGKARTLAEMKQVLNGRQGILLFRNGGAGHHTELWDNTHILQDGKAVSGGGAQMDENNIFGQPRVVFWEVSQEGASPVAVPAWLKGWWRVVQDGSTYYYFFSSDHVVTYTKTAPATVLSPPTKNPLNEGSVQVTSAATIVIDWNPADGGQTQETFVRTPTVVETMLGKSNRYGPLSGTKMK